MSKIRRIVLLTIFTINLTIFSSESLSVKNEEQHKSFFKSINLNFPFSLGLKEQIEAKNFYSAYLTLTGWMVKNDFFLKLKELFNRQFFSQKEELKLIADRSLSEIQPSENQIQCLLVTIFILTELQELYTIGNLSGEKAIVYWNAFYEQISRDYRTRKIDFACATRLLIASRLVFFKKAFRWKQKAEKFFRKKAQPLPDIVEKILKIYELS